MKRNAPETTGQGSIEGKGANNPSIPTFNKNVKNWIECAAFAVMTVGWRVAVLVVLIAGEVRYAIQ